MLPTLSDTGLTTPDCISVHRALARFVAAGARFVTIEASSHALQQGRLAGVQVDTAVFTNLTRDHLDYHGTMEAYFEAKMRLFDEVVEPNGTAVIWADDEDWSQQAINRAMNRGLNLVTVGRNGSTLRLVCQTPTQLGQVLMIKAQGNTHRVSLPLIGAYQAANILCAAGIVLATGGALDNVLDHMQRVQPVKGRLERAVITRAGAPVYVDYAHTPDALSAAIQALRPHVEGQLITVFGAGGDRDTGKRPEMGTIAVEMSDKVIVTDDNPRSEDPAAIRKAILSAAPGAEDVADRRTAISHAVEIAGAKDIILVAGKGHEQGQIIGDRTIPFDDVEVARECAGAQAA